MLQIASHRRTQLRTNSRMSKIKHKMDRQEMQRIVTEIDNIQMLNYERGRLPLG